MQHNIRQLFPALQNIPTEKFPKHIFIIPDGNGRWAKQKGKHALEGHTKGAEITKKILHALSDLQEVSVVTLWGFSSDNWKRSKEEVHGLMFILKQKVKETLHEVATTGRRFIHLGRKDRIPKDLLKILEKAEEKTKNNMGQIIGLAIDFGGEDQAVRTIKLAKENPRVAITKDSLWQFRDGKGIIKSADLLIRTSGEKRTSDIGWLNGAQTELYFIDKYFPDITTSDIVDAIVAFSKRERRLGARK